MNSILRIPLMCDQFQKSVRRKAESHQLRKSEREAIKILDSEGINADTQSLYFDKLIEKIDG